MKLKKRKEGEKEKIFNREFIFKSEFYDSLMNYSKHNDLKIKYKFDDGFNVSVNIFSSKLKQLRDLEKIIKNWK